MYLYYFVISENSTEIRKLKKKAYLKKNRTAPSDDELEMSETLRDSNIKDFSWTLASPKKDVLSSGRYSMWIVGIYMYVVWQI